jgi:hypothetical protein
MEAFTALRPPALSRGVIGLFSGWIMAWQCRSNSNAFVHASELSQTSFRRREASWA